MQITQKFLKHYAKVQKAAAIGSKKVKGILN